MTTFPAEVADFPFPFVRDSYHYTANVQAAGLAEKTEAGEWGSTMFRIGPEYRSLIDQRAAILAREPDRAAHLPHMRAAEWDAVMWIMGTMARDNPEHFEFHQNGADCVWVNHLLGVEQSFRFGDDATLPTPPLEYIGRQVTEDLVLLDQREGKLWADAGILTFASVWSLAFNIGMSFSEIHGPVPGAGPGGVFDRAQTFLMRLTPGETYRRLNWGLQTGDAIDMSMESFRDWMPTRAAVAAQSDGDVGDLLHLRVEVQHLIRLPRTGAILFTIGIRVLPISRLPLVPGWAERTVSVLDTLPADIREYKGIAGLDSLVISYLTSG